MIPIELFKLTRGSNTWTYTSSDYEVDYNGDRYHAVPIGRGRREEKNELSKANLEVKIDLYDELARLLLTTIDEEVLSLTLFIQTESGTQTAWKGRLSSIKPGQNELTMVFESVFTSLRRPGLRARYQKTCRHALYSRGCRLNSEVFAVYGQATAASGVSVTVPEAASQPDGYYTGGMIRGPDDSLRWIIAHTGSSLTLSQALESLNEAVLNSGYGVGYGQYYGGVIIKIYPGCDRLRQTCINKFNNLANYGGFPWIPHKNPMGGISIV